MESTGNALVLKTDLLAALRAVGGAAAKKTALPILAGVKITADGQTLTLETNDLEFAIQRTIDASVSEPFATVMPHKLLLDIVKTRGDVVTLTSSTVDGSRLQTLDVDDFPVAFNGFENAPQLGTVDAKAFEHITSVVAHAADDAKYGARPVLQGVSLIGKDSTLTAACSDGFRLAVSRAPYERTGDDFKLLSPARLGKLFKEQKIAGDVKLFVDRHEYKGEVNDTRLLFTFDGGQMMSRLIEGTFPDYNQIIPHETAGFFTVDADDLGRAMAQIRPFTKTNNDVDRFQLGAMNGTLPVQGKDENGGEIVADIPVVKHNVEHMTDDFALNERYVADLTAALKGKRLTVGLNAPQKPCKITVDGSTDTFVIMPMVIGAQ
jgi:DNA polymerase III subunit beta